MSGGHLAPRSILFPFCFVRQSCNAGSLLPPVRSTVVVVSIPISPARSPSSLIESRAPPALFYSLCQIRAFYCLASADVSPFPVRHALLEAANSPNFSQINKFLFGLQQVKASFNCDLLRLDLENHLLANPRCRNPPPPFLPLRNFFRMTGLRGWVWGLGVSLCQSPPTRPDVRIAHHR